MKKQILAACIAAISLSAMGCQEDSPKSLTPRTEIAVRPLVEPVRAEPKPIEPVTTTGPGVDAGAAEPKPVDPIALSHEEGRIVDHLARSAMLREEGDLDGALAEARRALFDAPEDLDALSAIDRLAKLKNDRQLRVSALERMAQLRPDDAMPLVQKARVLISMKDFDGAIQAANEAVKRDEKNPEAYQALGRAYLATGDLSPAIACFQKVLTLDADHGYALNNLGFAYLRANRNAEAVEVLTHAAQVLPNVAYVQNNLGIALERMGRTEEAKAAYAQASFLSPRYVKAQVNASRVAALGATSKDRLDTGALDSGTARSDAPMKQPSSGEPPDAPAEE